MALSRGRSAKPRGSSRSPLVTMGMFTDSGMWPPLKNMGRRVSTTTTGSPVSIMCLSPSAVILVVPLAVLGTVIALMMRGMDNNVYTQIGIVLLIALASKNAILVVEFARELHAGGMSIADAAVEATKRRFRPIIMTSFAFILGVVPLMKAGGAGAASQQSIGTVVFGGMLASTLLAIPFVPVFYVITQGFSERKAHRAAPKEKRVGS